MEGIKRGFKSILFYWKRNVFITVAFLVMFIVLLGIASIRKNMDELIDRVGREIGAELTVRITGVEMASFDSAIYFSIRSMEDLNNCKDIEDIEYVALANARGDGVKEVYSEEMAWVNEAAAEQGYRPTEEEKNAGDITVFGVDDIEKAWEFERREIKITEGEGISDRNKDEAVAVVSEAFLKSNFLEIGDEIKLVNTAEPFHILKVKVIGTHSSNYDEGIIARNPMNYIYVPLKTCLMFNGGKVVQATVHVKDPRSIEAISHKLQIYVKESTGQEFEIREDSMQYLVAIMPLMGVQRVYQIMFYITYSIFLLVFFLVSGRNILNRRKEIGVWISLGEKKRTLLFQIISEMMIPVFLGIAGACLAAFVLEKSIGTFFARQLASLPDMHFQMSVIATSVTVAVTVVLMTMIVLALYVIVAGQKVSRLLREDSL